MRLRREHIACFLLFGFLAGGFLAPVVHQLHHGIEILANDATHKQGQHEHPDFDAISDDAPHLQHTDLTCILCSFSLAGVADNPSPNGILDNSTFLSHGDTSYQIVHGSFHSIRGPPAYC